MEVSTTHAGFFAVRHAQQLGKMYGDLPYCTPNGAEYYISQKGKRAYITALIADETNYFLNKDDLRLMVETAKVAGIDHVELHTNFGLEINTQYETPEVVGLKRIVRLTKN